MARKGTVKPNTKHSKAWGKWHWYDGKEADNIIEWDDADLPDHLIEIGRLVGLHVQLPEFKKPSDLSLKEEHIEGCFAAFDPESKKDRIYLCVTGPVRKAAKHQFWDRNRKQAKWLSTLAKEAGGHHQGGYPRVKAKPVGKVPAIIYATDKKGDGPSNYIHHFSEETHGPMPVLCVDAKGRMWLVGGVYTCPTPGITD